MRLLRPLPSLRKSRTIEPMADVLHESGAAEQIQRYLEAAAYLLILTGFGALASTGGVDFLTTVGIGVALAVWRRLSHYVCAT